MKSNTIYTAAVEDSDELQATESGHKRSADEFATISLEYKARPQWMNWKVGEIKSDGKFRKIPIDPDTGLAIDDKNFANWQAFGDTVAHYCAGVGGGIAFCFSADDPYTGIDLDGCRNPDTGEICKAAMEIIQAASSDTEVSPSGTGVKIIGRAMLAKSRSRAADPVALRGLHHRWLPVLEWHRCITASELLSLLR